MNIEVLAASPGDKPVLRELLNLYLYDLSDLPGAGDLNEEGRYEYRYLDRYWMEADRHAFLVRAEGAVAGFSLVNTQTHSTARWCIAEFFVARRHRRRGVGTVAAHATFTQLPGEWEVWTDRDNIRAHDFWRHAVSSFARGSFREIANGHGGGPTFLFESKGERP
jgi:predicted acetyltransferase